MEKERRKTYKKPKIQSTEIDREISLQLQSPSSENPPEPGLSSSSDDTGSTSKSDSEESTKQNSFDENPFER